MRPASWTLTVLILATSALLTGCQLRVPPTPVRSFSTMDLLIEPADMPQGWSVMEGTPSRILDHLAGRDPTTADDASRIVFLAEPRQVWHEAAHSVYRFKTFARAKRVYGQSHPGKEPPLGWTYQSSDAEASKLWCRDLGPPDHLTYCMWSAYYDEYYIELSAALVPGKMSLQDMEGIVRIIDNKMVQYLGVSLE